MLVLVFVVEVGQLGAENPSESTSLSHYIAIMVVDSWAIYFSVLGSCMCRGQC